jgi:outer membrane protein assembly factor BamE (lipoprotein component of BamABCDE complex)
MKTIIILFISFSLSGCITTYAQVQQQKAIQRDKDSVYLRDLHAQLLEEKQKYIDANPGLSPAMKDAILNKGLVLGMNQEQVRISMGSPKKTTKTTTMRGTFEQWIYGNDLRPSSWKYLSFQSGLLTSWTE